jgi:DHA1 family tetracycline resistance protein-like MFS transporter
MTRRVSSSEQGQLQGAIASINGLTGLIGPTLFTQSFAHFISETAWRIPGAPFLLASLMLLTSGVIALRTTSHPSKVSAG